MKFSSGRRIFLVNFPKTLICCVLQYRDVKTTSLLPYPNTNASLVIVMKTPLSHELSMKDYWEKNTCKNKELIRILITKTKEINFYYHLLSLIRRNF